MAHVVGVPRRDPCRKCKLPVFLAERLTVGKKVYHRTCLKCARCSAQLSPGSFYETEVDDEYCCETCPDEEEMGQTTLQAGAAGAGAVADFESGASSDADAVTARSVQLRHEPVADSVEATVNPRPVRASIAARLAFFEQTKDQGGCAETMAPTPSSKASSMIRHSSDAKLLQKSVSDEEKSQSLKRMENSLNSSVFNNFAMQVINTTIGPKDDIVGEGVSSAGDVAVSKLTEMTTSDSEDGAEELSLDTQLPALPKTQPPSAITDDELANIDLKIVEPEDEQPQPEQLRFTAKANVQLVNNQPIKESESESPKKQEALAPKSVPQISKIQKVLLAPAVTTKRKAELQLQLETDKSQTPVKDVTNNNNNSGGGSNNNDSGGNLNSERLEGLSTNIRKHDVVADDVKLKVKTRIEPNDNDNCRTKEEILETDAQKTSPEVFVIAVEETASSMKSNIAEEAAEKVVESDSTRVQNTLESACAENENIQLRKQPEAPTGSSTLCLPSHEDIETTRRLSVVRARLHQFEVNANDDDSHTIFESDKSNNVESDDKANTRNSSKNKSHSEGAESVVCMEENLRENELKINESDTDDEIQIEKSRKQVPKDENNVEPTKENIINNTAVERKEATVEIEDEEVEKKENVFVNTDSVTIITPEPPAKIENDIQQSNLVEELSGLKTSTPSNKLVIKDYPNDLNPFGSDDDDDDGNDGGSDKENTSMSILRSSVPNTKPSSLPLEKQPQNLNPFDSSDDEIELLKSGVSSSAASTPSGAKVPPPRPPPPRISRNPFGDGESIEDQLNFSRRSSLTSSLTRRTPVPTPRTNLSLSQNPTPEPTPRLGSKSQTPSSSLSPALHNTDDYYGSANSLSLTPHHPHSLYRNSDIRGSVNSLTSSAGGTIRSRKQRRAPAPPSQPTVKELFPATTFPGTENVSTASNNTNNNISLTSNNSQPSTPGSSTVGTPKQGRKKRPAPAPPKPARHDATLQLNITVQKQSQTPPTSQTPQQQQQQQQPSPSLLPKNSFSYPLQSELDSKLSDEEKALLEGKFDDRGDRGYGDHMEYVSHRRSLRLIPLDASLLQDEDETGTGIGIGGSGSGKCDDLKHKEQEEEFNIVYRRVLIAPQIETPTHDGNPLLEELSRNESHNRQLEKLKDNKEAQNRNRQSQISLISSGADDSEPFYTNNSNKSSHGKWKRRKGPAPALPIPPRKVLQMLPLQEIKHELEIIEVQQQGLEKQGVILEKMIRDRCEDANGEPLNIVAGALEVVVVALEVVEQAKVR